MPNLEGSVLVRVDNTRERGMEKTVWPSFLTYLVLDYCK